MNQIDKVSRIDKEKINSEFFFQSLLEEAYAKQLLADTDVERIQLECLSLLAYTTERYNAGDSSSIRVEVAQSLMTSNLFTIGLWLKTYPSCDDAVEVIKKEK